MSKLIISRRTPEERQVERRWKFLSLSPEKRLDFLVRLNSYVAMMKGVL